MEDSTLNSETFLACIRGDLNYVNLPCITGLETSGGWKRGEIDIVQISDGDEVEFHCKVHVDSNSDEPECHLLSKTMLTLGVFEGVIIRANPSRCTIKLKGPERGHVIINKADTRAVRHLKKITDAMKRSLKDTKLGSTCSNKTQADNSVSLQESTTAKTMKNTGKRKLGNPHSSLPEGQKQAKKQCRKPLTNVRNLNSKVQASENKDNRKSAPSTSVTDAANISSNTKSSENEKSSKSSPATPMNKGDRSHDEQEKLKFIGQVVDKLWHVSYKMSPNALGSIRLADLSEGCRMMIAKWQLHRRPDPVKHKYYYEVIKKPMDFGTIRSNFLRNHYKTAEECIADVNQVFINCYEYGHIHMIDDLKSFNLEGKYLELMNDIPGGIDKVKLTSDIKGPQRLTGGMEDSRLKYLSYCVWYKLMGQMGTQKWIRAIDMTEPVSRTKHERYYDMVKQPMDLGTIARNLMTQKYKKAAECVYDIKLMFSNWYNLYDHKPSAKKARCLDTLFDKLTEEMPGGIQDIKAELQAIEAALEPPLENIPLPSSTEAAVQGNPSSTAQGKAPVPAQGKAPSTCSRPPDTYPLTRATVDGKDASSKDGRSSNKATSSSFQPPKQPGSSDAASDKETTSSSHPSKKHRDNYISTDDVLSAISMTSSSSQTPNQPRSNDTSTEVRPDSPLPEIDFGQISGASSLQDDCSSMGARQRQRRAKLVITVSSKFIPECHGATGIARIPAGWELTVHGHLDADAGNLTKNHLEKSGIFSMLFTDVQFKMCERRSGQSREISKWSQARDPQKVCHGFRLGRQGDAKNMFIKILLFPNYKSRFFRLPTSLSQALCIYHSARMEEIYKAFWDYIGRNKLQDEMEPEFINSTELMRKVFQVRRMRVSEIPQYMHCALQIPLPITVIHAVVLGPERKSNTTRYELDVDVVEGGEASISPHNSSWCIPSLSHQSNSPIHNVAPLSQLTDTHGEPSTAEPGGVPSGTQGAPLSEAASNAVPQNQPLLGYSDSVQNALQSWQSTNIGSEAASNAVPQNQPISTSATGVQNVLPLSQLTSIGREAASTSRHSSAPSTLSAPPAEDVPPGNPNMTSSVAGSSATVTSKKNEASSSQRPVAPLQPKPSASVSSLGAPATSTTDVATHSSTRTKPGSGLSSKSFSSARRYLPSSATSSENIVPSSHQSSVTRSSTQASANYGSSLSTKSLSSATNAGRSLPSSAASLENVLTSGQPSSASPDVAEVLPASDDVVEDLPASETASSTATSAATSPSLSAGSSDQRHTEPAREATTGSSLSTAPAATSGAPVVGNRESATMLEYDTQDNGSRLSDSGFSGSMTASTSLHISSKSQSSFLESIKEELCCAICTEDLHEPKDLHCSHTFCKLCLQKWLNSQTQKTSILCPICMTETPLGNDGISGLKTNHITKNLVIQFQSASVGSALHSFCKIHEGMRVRITCKTCDQFVCDKCTDVCKRLSHDVEDPPARLHNVGKMLHALADQKRKCLDQLQESHGWQKNWKSQVQEIRNVISLYGDQLKAKIDKDVKTKLEMLEQMSKEGDNAFRVFDEDVVIHMTEVDCAIQKQAKVPLITAEAPTTANQGQPANQRHQHEMLNQRPRPQQANQRPQPPQQNRETSPAETEANQEMEKVLKKRFPKIPDNKMLTFVASGHHLKESPVGEIVYQSW